MNEYLKQYIELQKQFRETKGKADSVRALYAFKEELEQSEDTQAKEVLVYVYDLLDFKKSAYELLSKIGDRSNPKIFRRLATMKEKPSCYCYRYYCLLERARHSGSAPNGLC